MRIAQHLLIITLSCFCGCASSAKPEECPVRLTDVLDQCIYTHVANPSIFAWMKQDSEITRLAIVGQLYGKYVLSIAARNPKSSNELKRKWTLKNINAMNDEPGDKWNIGTMRLDHPPTREDLAQLCKSLLWKDAPSWVYAE
jgi:hypothetical protein